MKQARTRSSAGLASESAARLSHFRLVSRLAVRPGWVAALPLWPAVPLLLLCLTTSCFESTLTVDVDDSLLADPDEFVEPDEVTERAFGEDLATPVTGIDSSVVTVTRVAPAAGPDRGGNTVQITGSGFTEDVLVFFDERMAQPRDTVMLDANTIAVVVPAGELGPSDVRVQVGEENAVRPDAYTYHGLYLQPASGSTAGNTFVTITTSGAELEPGVAVSFGDQACEDLRIVTPSEVTCRTPAGAVGAVDVILDYPGDEADLVAPGAFAYTENPVGADGGLGGTTIAGAVNVRVLNRRTAAPLPGAFVMVGDDPTSPLNGYTDQNGEITLSAGLLRGPVNLHVSLDCYIATSFVGMNASDATVLLESSGELRCAEDGPPGGSPGRALALSFVTGELVFPGSREFGANPWDVVPEPRSDELRVTYVYTTRDNLWSRFDDTSGNGTAMQRVVEGASTLGERGYPYSIVARPAGMAVYALAGLERTTTGEFTPYILGVARNVVTAPGERLTGVDIEMSIPLDRRLQVALGDVPERTATGPREFVVQSHLDLGAEGILTRLVRGVPIDIKRSATGGDLFEFFGQPALVGALSDARHTLVSGWYTDGYAELPYTEVITRGVLPGAAPTEVRDLLGIPVATAPTDGALMPADRIVRFKADGTEPDFFYVSLDADNQTPLWRFVVRGDVREVPIPDLTGVEGAGQLPGGFLRMFIRGIRVDGFEFNQFNYTNLRGRTWTHDAVNASLIKYETVPPEDTVPSDSTGVGLNVPANP